ncbi:MAG: HEPN domain-containing protein [Thermodesulfovibrionales bacterium]
MTIDSLAKSYLIKAQKRLKILDVLFREEDYSDVVREAQEIVELALKGLLRYVGIEPPKWHDVSSVLIENKALMPTVIIRNLTRITKISKRLRKERELAFYGDEDFIPTNEYDARDAKSAMKDAAFVVDKVSAVIKI